MLSLKLKQIYLFVFLFIFMNSLNSFAAPSSVPSSQTAGGLEKTESDIDKSRKLQERVESKKEKPEIKDEEKAVLEIPEGEKVLVKTINVEGAILLPGDEITKITSQYENRKISLLEMQKVADLITDAYRTKGYVTSRAYIIPQSIGEQGVLVIRVIEGKVGDLSVTGNKYFKENIYKKKFQLRKDDAFNYHSFQRSLAAINERPDRSVKAVLAPGKSPGSTDILIQAKDYLPIHVGYTHDNYGSRYVGRNRDSVTLEHNNLLGFDDQFYLQLMRTEDSLGTLITGRYIFPLKDDLNLGLIAGYARTKLGKEFADLDAIGKATNIGVFLNKALIASERLDIRFNMGFDYKKIRNTILGDETSRDDSRVVKVGVDIDNKDNFGRTLFTVELDQGIPNMWGGLDTKDSRASRIGAGGKFFKGVFNLYRAQPLPFSAALLFKNSAQYTNNTLTSAEEFQIGGPYSVRGYPPGEYAGDRGLYSSVELTLPYYFLPKSWKVPFAKEKWYDTTRFVLFYDWATVRMSNPQPTDIKSRTIKGCGFGFRFDLTNRISAKAEFAYPLGGPKSTDTKRQHVQPWFEVSVKF